MMHENEQNQQELLPDIFEKYDVNIQLLIMNYLKQLTPIEKQACKIAKAHLGSSFNIVKSNGYINWLKTNA